MQIDRVRDMLAEHHRVEEAIRLELIDLFDASPDNPEITRISRSQSCFSMHLSSMSSASLLSLSPEFYDYPLQWQRMQKILRNNEGFEAQLNKLQKIADDGKILVQEGGSKYWVSFHPDVVARLREILGLTERRTKNEST